jgi:glycosyltransferase involved in cell wall biosynthesis
MQPLVSIALCTYNGENFLAEQLDSLVKQTYPNLEIIVTDDRSTDGTYAVLTNYAQQYSFVKIFKNEYNLGHTKNFEKAISLCTGDYIELADQDDVWALDKITQMVANIGDSALIYHDSEFIDDKGNSLGKKLSDVINMYQGRSALPLLFMNCVTGHASLFKAELRKYLGSFNPEFHHDWWIGLIATQHGGIKYLDKTLVKYRQHGNSFTDILELKDSKTEPGKHAAMNLRWLKYIAANVPEVAPIANKIVDLHDEHTFFSSLRLMLLILSNYQLYYFTKRKSTTSKLNLARKFLNHKSGLLPR